MGSLIAGAVGALFGCIIASIFYSYYFNRAANRDVGYSNVFSELIKSRLFVEFLKYLFTIEIDDEANTVTVSDKSKYLSLVDNSWSKPDIEECASNISDLFKFISREIKDKGTIVSEDKKIIFITSVLNVVLFSELRSTKDTNELRTNGLSDK